MIAPFLDEMSCRGEFERRRTTANVFMKSLHHRRPEHRVRLWCAHAESGRRLSETRENARLLPGVAIPPDVLITCDEAEATENADAWVVAVPTAFLRDTISRFAAVRAADVPVISLTKGIEAATFRRPTEIIGEVLRTSNLAVLSGPSRSGVRPNRRSTRAAGPAR